MVICDKVQNADKVQTYKKTTVMFPADVMKKVRRFLVDHDFSSHDQSRIIVAAVKKFLEDPDMSIFIEDPDISREEEGTLKTNSVDSPKPDISIPAEEDFRKTIGDDLINPDLTTDQVELDIEKVELQQAEHKVALDSSHRNSQKNQKEEQRIVR